MEVLLLPLAELLEAQGLKAWAGATPWVYPAVNTLHIVGLVLLVGGIGVVDLRVAGLWRNLSLDALSRALTPLAVAGLILQLVSGLILFAADGRALAVSVIFQLKLWLVLAALVNVAIFRLWLTRDAGDRTREPSPAARLSAVASLTLWLATATAGRLIAYL